MQTSKQPQDLQTKALRLFCHLSTVKDGILPYLSIKDNKKSKKDYPPAKLQASRVFDTCFLSTFSLSPLL